MVGNWARESERFTPDLAVHDAPRGDPAAGGAFEKAAVAADIVITTYALATRDRTVLAEVPWRRIVLDEAQNMKNPEAKQTKARAAPCRPPQGRPDRHPGREPPGRAVVDHGDPQPRPARHRRRRSASVSSIPIERYRDEEAAEQLRRLTGPFMLRRLKTDRTIVADLPEKMEMNGFAP